MLAITNGRLYPITRGVIEKGTILIDRGKFVSVGSELDVPEGAQVVDAAGCHVYPGLVDAHTHHGVYAEVAGPEGADRGGLVAAA